MTRESSRENATAENSVLAQDRAVERVRSNGRRWAQWCVVGLQVVLFGLVVRCAVLQLGEKKSKFDELQQKYLNASYDGSAPRGRIRAAGGETLVRNRSRWRVAIDPNTAAGIRFDPNDEDGLTLDPKSDDGTSLEHKRARVAAALDVAERTFGDRPDWDEVRSRVLALVGTKKSGSRYVYLGEVHTAWEKDRFEREVRRVRAARFKAKEPAFRRGAFPIREEWGRVYPYGDLAISVVGETRRANMRGRDKEPLPTGIFGVELDYDDVLEPPSIEEPRLRGVDGFRAGGSVSAPRGADVRLTIDLKLQMLLEERMAQALEEHGAWRVTGCVVDPRDGSILAAANAPRLRRGDYVRLSNLDPSELEWHYDLRLKNFAYEPGSTIKPFFLAEAIVQGVDLTQVVTPIEKEWNSREFGLRRMFYDSGPSREQGLTIEESVIHSSNIGMARLGLMLKEDGCRRALTRFGILEHGERKGPWSLYTVTSLPMGYEMYVTPWSLVRAYCALINGGVAVEPHYVAAIDGREPPRRERQRLLDAASSAEVRRILRRAAVEGTGRRLDCEPVPIAGKSGTVKIFEDGQYQKVYRSSFVGFAPWDSPRFLVYVLVDRPATEKYYGAQVAGPVARELLGALMREPGNALGERVDAAVQACRSPVDAPTMGRDGGQSRRALGGVGARPVRGSRAGGR